jgi:hypothetical protein
MNERILAAVGALLLAGAAACSGAGDRSTSRSKAAVTDTTPVITPFGLISAGCVAEVGANDVVTATDTPPCPAPSAGDDAGTGDDAGNVGDDAGDDGEAGDDGGASVPSFRVNGWVEYADWTAARTPGRLATTWHVPDVPANDVGQTLFYFPSYEPSSGNAIVQPVLQYGVSAAGGGSYWAIASWWVGPNGAARHSSLLQVNPGDTIRGTMTTSQCDDAGGCKFLIVTRDETIDNARQLTVVESIPYTWTQAAVFEVYRVTDCSQLPANGVRFGSFVFTDQDGSPLGAAWKPEYSVTTHACNFQVTTDGSGVTLGW